MEEGEDDHTSRQGPLFLHVSYFLCLPQEGRAARPGMMPRRVSGNANIASCPAAAHAGPMSSQHY